MDGEGDNVELLNEPVFNSPPATEEVEDQEEQTGGQEEQEFVDGVEEETEYENAVQPQPIQDGGFLPDGIEKRITVQKYFSEKKVTEVFTNKRTYLPDLVSLKNDYSTFTDKQQTIPIYMLHTLSKKLANLIVDITANLEKVSAISKSTYRKVFATYDAAKSIEVWTLVETIVRLYLIVYFCQKHESALFVKTFIENKTLSIEKASEELTEMFYKVNAKPDLATNEDALTPYTGIFYTYRAGETILTLLTDIGKSFIAEIYGIPYVLINDSQTKFYYEDMDSFLEFLLIKTTKPPSTGTSAGTIPGPSTGTGTGTVPVPSTGTGTGTVPGPPTFARARTHILTGLRLPLFGGTRKLKVRKNNNTLKTQ